MAEDNKYVKEAMTEDIKGFILNLKNVMNAENSEFVLNMSSFYLSALDETTFLAHVENYAELV